MEKIISIIIPAYNVEKYINKCIDSIICKENDIEIIIVDDGSTDKTSIICNEYCENNDNIKVFHVKNGGQAKARNYGLDVATGKYIMFLDSDDYIDDDKFIEKIKKIIENEPDLIMYGYKKFWEGKNKYSYKKLLDNKKIRNYTLDYLIDSNYFKGCPWDKIIKASLLKDNKIYFPENMLSEDIKWCADLLKIVNNNKIYVLNENPYVYVQHKNSTSKKVKVSHVNDLYNIITYYATNSNDIMLLKYLSYEYCMSIGVINSSYCEKITKYRINHFYDYKWLLKYSRCKKVRIVYYISKIIGIKITGKILGFFVNIKKKGV